jgi:uncharacterized membrane protein
MRLTVIAPVIAAVSAFALSACSSPETASAPAEPAAPAAAVLSGVDLAQPVRALGTEPFWSVELTADHLAYTSPEGAETAPRPETVVQGTVATFEGLTDKGSKLSLTLTATECSDGMSDRTYPLTAIVKLGDRLLTGCAASTAAIMSAGESGPVV